jgi:endonuclease/exonuclease/phosphatase family metal-dependent hydrolase
MKRIREEAHALIAAGFIAVSLGSGWYLVDSEHVDSLEFVDVGWWNIRDFSDASRDDTEIRQIAAGMEGVDVLAIGELNDPTVLNRLTQELGSSWSWAATPQKVGHSPYTAEYYGFVWDGDMVEMVTDVNVDTDPHDEFDREPAWATFRTLDGSLDFTLIGVHVTWGDLVGPRKAEVRAMRDVWHRVQAATPGDDDLIVTGDFNRNIGCDSFDPLLSITGVRRANPEPGPTKINSSSTYDQIFLSTHETTEWTGEYFTGLFDIENFGDDDDAASLAVSDHRPVWITLVIPNADDDGSN